MGNHVRRDNIEPLVSRRLPPLFRSWMDRSQPSVLVNYDNFAGVYLSTQFPEKGDTANL